MRQFLLTHAVVTLYFNLLKTGFVFPMCMFYEEASEGVRSKDLRRPLSHNFVYRVS